MGMDGPVWAPHGDDFYLAGPSFVVFATEKRTRASICVDIAW